MSIADELTKSGEDLRGAIEGLTAKEMTRPRTIGDWSIRDVILHLAMWEGEVLKALAIFRAGRKVDWAYVKDAEGISRFNEFWISNMKHLTVRKVLAMFDEIHSAVIADVSSLTASKRKALPGWVKEITVEHNAAHVKKIVAYRKSLGK